MNTDQESNTNLSPLTPIRVETALSRYPVHRLAKHGDIAIDIREESESGEVSIKWEVNHISKLQPGPLAYKLDTLVINRRIEEAVRPVPRMIRLGSLKEIAAQLDLGGDTNLVKKALRQNASAFIIAKIRYKRPDGSEKKLEADFNRYSVIFTGEEMPDGRKADAVYIILNDVFMNVINSAQTRPLDYDYLKFLPPASQRFYELLSYQMYATIKNDRPRAKLLYSEFCKHAPLKRHADWDDVRSQLAKIHTPHRKSGYIAKIDYQQTTDSSDQADWIIFYTPGPKARAEYRAFTRRGSSPVLLIERVSSIPEVTATEQKQLDLKLTPPRISQSKTKPLPSPLVAELVQRGVTEKEAVKLVEQYPERIHTQIDVLDGLPKKKLDKIDDPAAYLVAAIRNDNAVPKGHVPRAERERQAEVKRQKDEDAAAARRQQREKDAAEKAERQAINAYRKGLTPEQLTKLEADAVAQADAAIRQSYEETHERVFRRLLLGSITDEHIARLLQAEAKQEEPA